MAPTKLIVEQLTVSNELATKALARIQGGARKSIRLGANIPENRMPLIGEIGLFSGVWQSRKTSVNRQLKTVSREINTRRRMY